MLQECRISREDLPLYGGLIPEPYQTGLLKGELFGVATFDREYRMDRLVGVILCRVVNVGEDSWQEIVWLGVADAYGLYEYGADLIRNRSEEARATGELAGSFAILPEQEDALTAYFLLSDYVIRPVATPDMLPMESDRMNPMLAMRVYERRQEHRPPQGSAVQRLGMSLTLTGVTIAGRPEEAVLWMDQEISPLREESEITRLPVDALIEVLSGPVNGESSDEEVSAAHTQQTQEDSAAVDEALAKWREAKQGLDPEKPLDRQIHFIDKRFEALAPWDMDEATVIMAWERYAARLQRGTGHVAPGDGELYQTLDACRTAYEELERRRALYPVLSEPLRQLLLFEHIPEMAELAEQARRLRDSLSALLSEMDVDDLSEEEREELRELYAGTCAVWDTLSIRGVYIDNAARMTLPQLLHTRTDYRGSWYEYSRRCADHYSRERMLL